MRIGTKSLLAAAAMSVMAVPAIAQDAEPVSYQELLDRIARLEAQVDQQDGAPPAPAQDGYGQDGYACGICDTCCDSGGLYAMYEHVIVAPYFSRNTSFVERVAGDPAVAGVDDRGREFNWDLEYSPRIEVGYLNGEGMGGRVRYWHFEHSEGVRDGLPAGNAATIRPSPSGNIGIAIAGGNTLAATHSMNVNVLDLEAVKRWDDCQNRITGSFGLRYARMEQHLTGREFDAQNVLQEQVSARHDFHGIGPTISVEGLRRFRCSNWGAFINLRTSVLYGDSKYHAQDVNGALAAPATLSDRYISRNDHDLIPIGEMQLGLDYTSDIFFARVALESQYWINGGSASGQQDRTFNEEGSPRESDMGFLGLSVATGVTY